MPCPLVIVSYTWAAGPSRAPLSGHTSSPGLPLALQTRPSLSNTEREKITPKTPTRHRPHRNTALRSRARRQPPGHDSLPLFIPHPDPKDFSLTIRQGRRGSAPQDSKQKKKIKKKRRKRPKAPPRPLKQNEGQGRAGGSPSLPPFIAAEPSDWLPLFAAGYALSKILYYCVGRPGDSLFFP